MFAFIQSLWFGLIAYGELRSNIDTKTHSARIVHQAN
jgi:hypothetical protein